MSATRSWDDAEKQELVKILPDESAWSQQIDDAVLEKKIKGALPVAVERDGAQTRLVCTIGDLPSLRVYYRTLLEQNASPRRRREFCTKTLLQLLQTVISIEQAGLDAEAFSLELDQIFVDPDSEEISLVYWPVRVAAEQAHLESWFRRFLAELTGDRLGEGGASSTLGEDFLQRYDAFFQSEEGFSPLGLANHLLRGRELRGTQESSVDDQQVLEEKQRIFYHATQANQRSRASLRHKQKATWGKSDLREKSSDTKPPAPNYPYIMREKTKEIVVVDQFPFRIGKKRQENDFHIADNPAISRAHAEIIYRNGRYYIRDNHSTNKTKVAGVPIQPDQETPLEKTVTFRLANETFLFHEVEPFHDVEQLHAVEQPPLTRERERGTTAPSRLLSIDKRSKHAHHDSIPHRHRNDESGQSG